VPNPLHIPSSLLALLFCIAGCGEVVVNPDPDTSQEDKCSSAADCADPGTCRSVACEAGSCNYTVLAGFCYVDSQCFNDDQSKPGNACLICAPTSTTSTLINKPCDAGQTCNVASGECEAEAGDTTGDTTSTQDTTTPEDTTVPDACTPDCPDNDQFCGDDGCGNACNTCANNETCNADNQCECIPRLSSQRPILWGRWMR
jgi:hypothetical protein